MFSLTQCNACSVYYTLFCLVGLTWMSSQESTSAKQCAYFSFENSTTRTNSVDVTENMNVTLIFYLKNKTCSNMENITFTIRKLDNTSNNYIPQCDILLKNGTCRNSTHGNLYCGCRNTFGEYTFSTIVNKSDITWWKWTTKEGQAEDFYLWFNETQATEWPYTSVSTIDDQALLATSPTRTFDSSSSNTVDEEVHRSIAIAVGACLIIIICLVTVICVNIKGQEKLVKAATDEDSKLDNLKLNQIYNRPVDNVALYRDLIHDDDFAEIYFSNNLA